MREADGKFGLGNPGKPKGATNKLTDELRGKITDFLFEEFDTIKSDFKAMKPGGYRTRLYTELLRFALPTL